VADWEDELADLTTTAADEFLIGGRSVSAKRTGNLIDSLHVPTGHPKVAPARLRSTWLANHIQAGKRLPELCIAAGLKGVTVISDLLEFVKPLEHAEAMAMLRRREP
jgi:hypothetical protein